MATADPRLGDRRDSRRRRRSDSRLAVTDTIKVVDGSDVTATLDRTTLVAVQTPQAFRRQCFAQPTGREARPRTTPRSSRRWVAESSWLPGGTNRKITEIDDLEWARRTIGVLK